MADATDSSTPSRALAARVANRLSEKGMLPKEAATKLLHKIEKGQMTSADWKLAFEMALDLHKKT